MDKDQELPKDYCIGECFTLPNGDCIGIGCAHEIKDVVEPLPYTEPSKELQELFKFIDDAMKEVVQGMYTDLPPLGDSRRTTQLKLEAYERMKQDAKLFAAEPVFLEDKE